MIFYSRANNLIGFELSLVSKVINFGTRKWPISKIEHRGCIYCGSIFICGLYFVSLFDT